MCPLIKNAALASELYKKYRPIANLLFFSKLIERVVLLRLDDHMNRHALHSSYQFGYKKHISTELMLLQIVDEILMGMDSGNCTVVLFLDLSAAFDTIDINILLDILSKEIGMGGVALKWMQSFLMGRKQAVQIDECFSEFLEVNFGVPQGSSLGPVLFNIYVRSLPTVFKKCNFNCGSFADDTNGRKSFAISFQFTNLTAKITECLDEIKIWMDTFFLKINASKTEILLCYPRELSEQIIIQGVIYENDCIRFSNEVKNVGVWLDQMLNFNKQVNATVSSCYKSIKDIGSIRNSLSKKDAESLVHAAVASKLDYCNSLYYGISLNTLNKLQKVQNAAARLIARVNSRTSISPVIYNLHWLRIESRVIFKLLLIVHKTVWGICNTMSINFKNYTRSDDDYLLLQPSSVKTKYGQRTFSYAAPKLWNALPYNIRSEQLTDKFKKMLKSILITDTDGLKRRALSK